MVITIFIALLLALISLVISTVSISNVGEMNDYVKNKISGFPYIYSTKDDLRDLISRIDKIHDELFVKNYFFNRISIKDEFIRRDNAVSFKVFGGGCRGVFIAYCHKDEHKKFESIIKEYAKEIDEAGKVIR